MAFRRAAIVEWSAFCDDLDYPVETEADLRGAAREFEVTVLDQNAKTFSSANRGGCNSLGR